MTQIRTVDAASVVPDAAVSFAAGEYTWFVSQLLVIASAIADGVPITVGVYVEPACEPTESEIMYGNAGGVPT